MKALFRGAYVGLAVVACAIPLLLILMAGKLDRGQAASGVAEPIPAAKKTAQELLQELTPLYQGSGPSAQFGVGEGGTCNVYLNEGEVWILVLCTPNQGA